MNWRRGFFRLWLAFSVCWVGAVVFFESPITACVKVRHALDIGNPFDCFVEDGVVNGRILALAFAPVLLSFLIGLVGGWVIGGFSGSRDFR
jgi:hypothetical protein